MVAKLTLHGLDLDIFLISFAMSIYAYTLENPSLYKIVNGQMFDPKQGPGGVSVGLRACLPFTARRVPVRWALLSRGTVDFSIAGKP
jgi:hypothetical protein